MVPNHLVKPFAHFRFRLDLLCLAEPMVLSSPLEFVSILFRRLLKIACLRMILHQPVFNQLGLIVHFPHLTHFGFLLLARSFLLLHCEL